MPSAIKWGIGGIIVILLLRVFTLGEIPLTEPSEGRFAASALRMLLSGEWLVPQVYKDGAWVYYLAKPPLHMWLTALSLKLFGINEWAARFPSFISLLGTIALIWKFGSSRLGRETALIGICFFLTCVGGFWVAVGCVTDGTLTLCITGIFVTFASALDERNSGRARRILGYITFIFAGVGLLAKGPVVTALTVPPILIWMALTKNWKFLRGFPLVPGLIVMSAIALPWYLMTEQVSPGFLKYYILNENILRYLSTEAGIKFGSMHRRVFGTIWWYGLVFLLPWILFLIGLFSREKRHKAKESLKDEWVLYAVLGGIFPLIFFSPAPQLLATYALPALPFLTLIIAHTVNQSAATRSRIVRSMVVSSVLLAAVFTVVVLILNKEIAERTSISTAIQYIEDKAKRASVPIGVVGSEPASAQFYIAKYPRMVLESGVSPGDNKIRRFAWLIVKQGDMPRMTEVLKARFDVVHTFRRWIVLRRMR